MVNSLPAYTDKDIIDRLKSDTANSIRMELSDYVYNTAMIDRGTGIKTFTPPFELIKKVVLNGLNIKDSNNVKIIKTGIKELTEAVNNTYDKYIARTDNERIDIVLSQKIVEKGLSEETCNIIRYKILGVPLPPELQDYENGTD